MTLVAVNGSIPFWERHGFVVTEVGPLYGKLLQLRKPRATMVRKLPRLTLSRTPVAAVVRRGGGPAPRALPPHPVEIGTVGVLPRPRPPNTPAMSDENAPPGERVRQCGRGLGWYSICPSPRSR